MFSFAQQLVVNYLKHEIETVGYYNKGYKHLAKELGVSTSTVQNTLRKLLQHRRITSTRVRSQTGFTTYANYVDLD